eukprot:TRINITY_DN697_c1_g1_i1.p1 TRINITY_DN697_c1_g1~~TRINITY_DN697_c1_g1_i1.p1  ORF type:complete len:354 (+),score=125.65 TRINITY_DN697_c1_g1_i1:1986-3047(+)
MDHNAILAENATINGEIRKLNKLIDAEIGRMQKGFLEEELIELQTEYASKEQSLDDKLAAKTSALKTMQRKVENLMKTNAKYEEKLELASDGGVQRNGELQNRHHALKIEIKQLKAENDGLKSVAGNQSTALQTVLKEEEKYVNKTDRLRTAIDQMKRTLRERQSTLHDLEKTAASLRPSLRKQQENKLSMIKKLRAGKAQPGTSSIDKRRDEIAEERKKLRRYTRNLENNVVENEKKFERMKRHTRKAVEELQSGDSSNDKRGQLKKQLDENRSEIARLKSEIADFEKRNIKTAPHKKRNIPVDEDEDYLQKEVSDSELPSSLTTNSKLEKIPKPPSGSKGKKAPKRNFKQL